MAKEKQLEKTKSLDNFTTEKINVITNCLFGDYVEGEYVIPDEIKKELLEDKKVKKSVYKNSVFCNAYIVGYGDVVFEATFQQNTVKNVAKAELFVLENEYRVNGYIQNTIRTKIAEFIDVIDNFIEKAYEHFNISVTEDEDVKKYDLKEDISLNAYINAKKNFNLNMDKLTVKDYNKLYKKYVTARLERLKKRKGGFSGQVLDRFNSEFAKIEKYFLRDGNYKAVSELLDKCIEDCVGVNPNFKKEEQEMFADLTPLVEEFSREAADIAEAMHDKALKGLNKPDKEKINQLDERINAGRYEAPPVATNNTNAQQYDRESSSSTSGVRTGGNVRNNDRRGGPAGGRNERGDVDNSLAEQVKKPYNGITGNPLGFEVRQKIDSETSRRLAGLNQGGEEFKEFVKKEQKREKDITNYGEIEDLKALYGSNNTQFTIGTVKNPDSNLKTEKEVTPPTREDVARLLDTINATGYNLGGDDVHSNKQPLKPNHFNYLGE